MNLDEQIAKVASLIGDRSRAAILIALMEGKALTAGELALRANISPQTASNHLKKLMDASLIELIKTPTRYRYYKITSPLVAKTLESLSLLLPSENKRPPRHEKLDHEICFARTCYDHLAGTLGVKITNALLKKQYIEIKGNEFILTKNGKTFFKILEINYEELIKMKRQFATPCLDWTEREYHLAGSLGAAVLKYLLKDRLLLHSKRKSRVMQLTTKGQLWFKDKLNIELNKD